MAPSVDSRNTTGVLTAFIVLALTASIVTALVFVGFVFRRHYKQNIEETAKKETFVQMDHRARLGTTAHA